MSESISPGPSYGTAPRGVDGRDVEMAADALLRMGERPTIEKVRARIGRGSPNTINPLLDRWWQRLAARLDAGPAALHRLPEAVAHVAEALWMQALDEGRRRAEQELRQETRSAESRAQDLEVRSHVLTLREAELDARLQRREREIEDLRQELRLAQLKVRQSAATLEMKARQIDALEAKVVRKPTTARRPPAKQVRPGGRSSPATRPRAKAVPRVPKLKRRQASRPRRP